MSIKKSIVTRVTANGTWEGKFGLMYKFEIEMENGDVGENLSKAEICKFKEGQEAEYEFIDGDWPKIKTVSNFQPRGNYSNNNADVQNKIRWGQSINLANLQFCHGLITESEFDDKANEMYEKLKKVPKDNLPFDTSQSDFKESKEWDKAPF
tara:strand:+ start:148 stop:603 length:456 start_codon:yes stop_codon:yes gene_type:complete